MRIMYRKGHRFYGPNGQYYTANHDISRYDTLTTNDVTAHGSAPEPIRGERVPDWFKKYLRP